MACGGGGEHGHDGATHLRRRDPRGSAARVGNEISVDVWAFWATWAQLEDISVAFDSANGPHCMQKTYLASGSFFM